MHLGEIVALTVAVTWTASAIFFEKAGKNIGSLAVNFIRIIWSFLLLGITLLVTKQTFLPMDATAYQWFWLGLSGVVGLFLGDMFLFKSYIIMGARTSSLIMSTAPILTTIIGWFFLNETLGARSIVAILISVTGVMIVIVNKNLKVKVPAKGILYAFLGALGQATGLILSKKGIGDYDPIAATQIRLIFALILFLVMITSTKQWRKVKLAVMNTKGMKDVFWGSFLGGFIGITLSLYAVQQTHTGVASTLMALVPVLIILPSAIVFKEKIAPNHVIGAIISIIGVSLFFF